MSERVQITVPDDVAQEWRDRAHEERVSVSAWVQQQVNRPDAMDALTRVLARIEDIRDPGRGLTREEAGMITELQDRADCTWVQALRIAVRHTWATAVAPLVEGARINRECDAVREVLGRE